MLPYRTKPAQRLEKNSPSRPIAFNRGDRDVEVNLIIINCLKDRLFKKHIKFHNEIR